MPYDTSEPLAEPIDADALRIRHEYLDAPGLQLTIPQVARLLDISTAHAAAILEELVRERFLETVPDCEPTLFRRSRGVTVA